MSQLPQARPGGTVVEHGDVSRLHTFILRKKILSFLGQKFHIYDTQWNLLLYSKMKAFKLKEDIRVYADEAATREIMAIKARQIIDWSAAYDVIDSISGTKIGALRRKGWASLVRDEWMILDPEDREIGKIQEDSLFAALVRRFILALIPQSYTITLGGREVGEVRQHFNPFVFKATMDLTADPDRKLPRLLALAAGLLLMAIEGRQN